jgi:hypothetical protein
MAGMLPLQLAFAALPETLKLKPFAPFFLFNRLSHSVDLSALSNLIVAKAGQPKSRLVFQPKLTQVFIGLLWHLCSREQASSFASWERG